MEIPTSLAKGFAGLGIVMDSGTACHDEAIDRSLQKKRSKKKLHSLQDYRVLNFF